MTFQLDMPTLLRTNDTKMNVVGGLMTTCSEDGHALIKRWTRKKEALHIHLTCTYGAVLQQRLELPGCWTATPSPDTETMPKYHHPKHGFPHKALIRAFFLIRASSELGTKDGCCI